MLICASVIAALTLASCNSAAPAPAPNSTGALPSAAPPSHVVESVEPWSFRGAQGHVIRTHHYRIFTTERNAVLMARLPGFLESALTHYRTAITPLPAPRLRLDTYLMDNRPQWVRLTQQLLGARGERYTQIPRGGFATRGVGVYFDIGVFDTLAIAAHEGWHQYTQRSFREHLPIWLEEGIATFMEGHKWDGEEPIFLPWTNVERFDQLRAAHAKGALLSLEKLLATSPADPAPSAQESLVTYYAQVWALALFLDEGAGGRHRAGLRAILSDAADGLFRRTLLVRLGREQATRAITTSRGPGALLAYLDDDLATLSRQYDRFIAQVVASGSRDRIVSGRSPIVESAP